MFVRGRGAGVWVVCAMLGLAGCQDARHVCMDARGGVVAIPDNSNTWPFYYRDKAAALIQQKCPNGFEIVCEEEVVVGISKHRHVETQKDESPALVLTGLGTPEHADDNLHPHDKPVGYMAVPLGEGRKETRETITSQDVTEWRITYRAK